MKDGIAAQKEAYQPIHDNDRQQLPVKYTDWEKSAKKILDSAPFDYVESGAGTEETLRRNRYAFSKWQIQPQLLQDVASRNLEVSLVGNRLKHPVILAPVGNQSIVHPEADLASARAAKLTETPYTVSTVSSFSMEEIAAELGDTSKFFQLYWTKDNDITVSLVQRAEAAGYDAIFITIDSPILGWREKDITNGYSPLQRGHGVANFISDPVFYSKLGHFPEENMDRAIQYVCDIIYKPSLTWDNLAFIKQQTKLPIILKGILHPNDATRAIKSGVDGIVVSNHGGRQLDGSAATIEVLSDIRKVVPMGYPVLLDSGIRSGADVVKAIALGADAILIGRPYIYGLAVDGERGVKKVVENLLADLDVTLAVSGQSSIQNLDSSLLRRNNSQ